MIVKEPCSCFVAPPYVLNTWRLPWYPTWLPQLQLSQLHSVCWKRRKRMEKGLSLKGHVLEIIPPSSLDCRNSWQITIKARNVFGLIM